MHPAGARAILSIECNIVRKEGGQVDFSFLGTFRPIGLRGSQSNRNCDPQRYFVTGLGHVRILLDCHRNIEVKLSIVLTEPHSHHNKADAGKKKDLCHHIPRHGTGNCYPEGPKLVLDDTLGQCTPSVVVSAA